MTSGLEYPSKVEISINEWMDEHTHLKSESEKEEERETGHWKKDKERQWDRERIMAGTVRNRDNEQEI